MYADIMAHVTEEFKNYFKNFKKGWCNMYIRNDVKADGVGKERAQEAIHWEVTSKSHLCEDNDRGTMAENVRARE